MKKKILISDKIAQEGLDLLEKNGSFEVVYKTDCDVEELKKQIKDAHALIIRSATKVTEEIINASEKLEVIARAGIGLDNVDIPRATEKGVVVMNTPGGNTVSTAEQAVGMIFAISRNTPQADASMKQQKWEKKKMEGVELKDKTVAVIGLGRIGMEVARKCRGLGMRVIGYDPYIPAEKVREFEVEVVALEEVWKLADYITVHTPLTDQTRDIINKDVFPKLKPTVRLINCARGGIYNENDLYEALKEGKIAGAALDVFTEEPPKNIPPFHELENVVLTPHLGASTKEAQVSVAVEAAQNIMEYLETGIARSSVNFASLNMTEYNALKPFINLVEKMGYFQGAVLKGKIKTVQIYYSGEFGDYNLEPVTSAYLKGLIDPFIDWNVNYVNAPIIAKERGIKVQTGDDSEVRDYTHLVTIKAEGENGTNELWGTVIGKQPWIVKYDDYLVDFIPTGKMLVMHNNDVPNVIGSIGTFLGERNVNIANLHLARTKRGGEALVILELDDELSQEFLDQLLELPQIIDLNFLSL
ncbi:MAG TPA: phosphoglycerate dehydrogenase [Spirochaetota bacterium]|nr:phosphoglycerate dehydrogenase [Spirochaetota bacterium]